ncbi:MAG: SPOR domain-containing protein [Telluria sp.]|nr:SPOR domain-containing protein [Telluria sp.]
MGFFSFLGTKKQESASEDPGFTSRSEEESRAHRNRITRSKKQPDGAASASADTALPEKKRARRRLIGAIALVLAAIIGLPMLLDSEQKSVPDDIAIEIPSPDIPAAPIAPVVPVAPAGASSSGSVSAAAGLSQQEEIIDPEPAPAIAPAPVVAAAPQPTVEVRPAPKSEPQLLPKLEPKPKPESRPAAKSDEAARARAILEGRTDTAAAEKTSTNFALQVAALATQEKVDELQGRLKGAGIKSYTQKIATASGSRIRVRVGPFSSKEEAEKMRAKLLNLGFGGTLVPVS